MLIDCTAVDALILPDHYINTQMCFDMSSSRCSEAGSEFFILDKATNSPGKPFRILRRNEKSVRPVPEECGISADGGGYDRHSAGERFQYAHRGAFRKGAEHESVQIAISWGGVGESPKEVSMVLYP